MSFMFTPPLPNVYKDYKRNTQQVFAGEMMSSFYIITIRYFRKDLETSFVIHFWVIVFFSPFGEWNETR